MIFTYPAISRHLNAKFSPADAEILLKFTYSGMVLAADATLSLDSFFFTILEAIFAKISRIFKDKAQKLDLCQCKALLSRQPIILVPVLCGQLAKMVDKNSRHVAMMVQKDNKEKWKFCAILRSFFVVTSRKRKSRWYDLQPLRMHHTSEGRPSIPD